MNADTCTHKRAHPSMFKRAHQCTHTRTRANNLKSYGDMTYTDAHAHHACMHAHTRAQARSMPDQAKAKHTHNSALVSGAKVNANLPPV